MLTAEQRESFDRDGFLAIEDAVTPEACATLIGRAEELVDAFEPATVSVFSTKNQSKTTDEYFLSSGGEVRFFFEEEAFDDDGELRQPKALSINKIGHAEHDVDPVFSAFSRQPAFAEIAADLGFADPLLLQSMYIFKQPKHRRRGGQPPGRDVPLHRPDHGHRFLGGAAGRDPRERLPVGTSRRPQDVAAQAVRRQRRPDDPLRRARPVAVARVGRRGAWCRWRPRPARWCSCTGCSRTPPGPTGRAKSRHAYSVHIIDGTADYPADNWLQRAADASAARVLAGSLSDRLRGPLEPRRCLGPGDGLGLRVGADVVQGEQHGADDRSLRHHPQRDVGGLEPDPALDVSPAVRCGQP